MKGRGSRGRIFVLTLVAVCLVVGSGPPASAQDACGGGPQYLVEVLSESGHGFVHHRCVAWMADILRWARFDPFDRDAAAPTEDLGQRYVIVVTQIGPGDERASVRQDLYPQAAGGPLVFSAPGQIIFASAGDYTIPGGWARVSMEGNVASLLRRNGVPLPFVVPAATPTPPPSTASSPASTSSVRASSPPPSRSSSAPGPDLVTVLFVTAAAAGIALWFLRRRGPHDETE